MKTTASMVRDEFDTMALQYGPALLRWAAARSGQVSDAWDLVQDAFERALRKRPRRSGPGHLRRWLFTVIKNRHVDNRRTAACQKVADLDVGTLAESDAHEISPWRCVDMSSVRAAVARLPASLRKPLLMRMAGHPAKEIAQRLSIQPATVATRVFRARRHVRRALEKQLSALRGEPVAAPSGATIYRRKKRRAVRCEAAVKSASRSGDAYLAEREGRP